MVRVYPAGQPAESGAVGGDGNEMKGATDKKSRHLPRSSHPFLSGGQGDAVPFCLHGQSQFFFRTRLVSIHAPARGATRGFEFRGGFFEFQSTPPRGGDRFPQRSCASKWAFQSTPPRGGRPRRRRSCSRCTCRFNPRPRAGGDPGAGLYLGARGSFNPRPRAGGDTPGRSSWISMRVFQSTPPRGGRHAMA